MRCDSYARGAEKLGKNAYRRSRLCEIVAEYASRHDIAVSLEKVPGIRCKVDWVGDKAHLTDVDTGKLIPIHIFVIALPYSSYFYGEGFFDEKMGSWLTEHMHGFEYFGGGACRSRSRQLQGCCHGRTVVFRKKVIIRKQKSLQ